MEPHTCKQRYTVCAHGHPKTPETTRAKKVRVKGKIYIVRECLICHANRTAAYRTATPSWLKRKSKWSRIRKEAEALV